MRRTTAIVLFLTIPLVQRYSLSPKQFFPLDFVLSHFFYEFVVIGFAPYVKKIDAEKILWVLLILRCPILM